MCRPCAAVVRIRYLEGSLVPRDDQLILHSLMLRQRGPGDAPGGSCLSGALIQRDTQQPRYGNWLPRGENHAWGSAA